MMMNSVIFLQKEIRKILCLDFQAKEEIKMKMKISFILRKMLFFILPVITITITVSSKKLNSKEHSTIQILTSPLKITITLSSYFSNTINMKKTKIYAIMECFHLQDTH